MTQSREQRLAYMRGYHRGHMRMYEHVRKLLKVAQGLRARLKDTDTARSCHTCDRWKRGGDRTLWGVCRADFEYFVEPRMWAEVGPAERAPVEFTAEIVTSEDFGCVCWLPRTNPGG